MLKYILLISVSLFSSTMYAQSVSISNNGSLPHSSAMLDVQSTSKGILIPRMTLAQRNLVPAPAEGLMIYQTDNTPGLYIYIGTAWNLLASAANVWTTAGNGGMDPNTQFIGTTDNTPLRFRINNKWAGELNSLYRNLSIGDSSGIFIAGIGYNTSFGHKSLRDNQNGFENTAVGYEALSRNGESYNVGIGYQALLNNIYGSANTAVGNKALEYNIEGSRNTAIGRWALNYNVDGYDNTAVGFEAMSYNSTGIRNTALGAYALDHNRSNNNVAVGFQALKNNTLGSENIAIGAGVLEDNIEGYQNTGIGYHAMYFNVIGSGNTAQGYTALWSNHSGNNNTAIGKDALLANNSGNDNTAIGTAALYYNLDGHGNTAVGKAALQNSEEDYNTAVGYRSLFTNEAGNDNTAVGGNTIEFNVNGTSNVAVGSHALNKSETSYNTAVGSYSLFHSTTGSANTATGHGAMYYNTGGTNNTALGDYALRNNQTGSYNVAIGKEALFNSGSGNYNIAVGAYSGTLSSDLYNTIGISNTNILHAASNQAVIGNTSHVWIGGQVGWSTYSDARLKTDIREDVKGLDFINRLHPVTYHRDIDAQVVLTGNPDELDFPNKYDIEQIKFSGFLAQEVEVAANASGYDFSGITVPKDEHSVYSLSYESFVVPLVKAVQEQQAIIEELMRKMEVLEERISVTEAEAKAKAETKE
ncbi:MAG TPA: tail fiber domain-containing protein [Saprospiraceae bacterium]|nr:tail fiber domain-containing protein [Saprospiraceae bacterium]